MPHLLDICIPTRNRADYLDGLLNQLSDALSRDLLHDLVGVIVSENFSQDDSRKVLDSWAEIESRWEFSSTHINIGADANCERLINRSRADYVWVLGDDDELYDIKSLYEVVQILKQNKYDLVLLAEMPGQQNQISDLEFSDPASFFAFMADTDPDLLRRATWISSRIIRRRILTVGSKKPRRAREYRLSYDLWNGLRKSRGKIIIRRKPTVRPRQYSGTRDSTFPNQKQLRKEWRLLYRFLSRKFRIPELARYSDRWIDSRAKSLTAVPRLLKHTRDFLKGAS